MGLHPHKSTMTCIRADSQMGLQTHGEHGAKRMLLRHSVGRAGRAPAFSGGPNLGARAAIDFPAATAEEARARTVLVADGTVFMATLPSADKPGRPAPRTLDDLVDHTAKWLQSALAAARYVVLVFDEPEHVSPAKHEEQRSRDRRRKRGLPECSEDLQTIPTSDAFDLATLEQLDNAAEMITTHRATRVRAYDEIMKRVMERLQEWDANCGLPEGSWGLVLDGIDERGAGRPLRGARRPGIMISHDFFAALWPEGYRRDFDGAGYGSKPIGEGDMKLPDWVERWRAFGHESEFLRDVDYFLLHTNDTDSLAIELLAAAKRLEEDREDEEAADLTEGEDCEWPDGRPPPPPPPPPPKPRVRVVLAFLQTWVKSVPFEDRKLTKAQEAYSTHVLPTLSEEERRQHDTIERALHNRILFWDVGMLHDDMLELLNATRLGWRQRREAIAMLAGALAMGGCDFVSSLVRTDRAIDAVRAALAQPPARLEPLLSAARGLLQPDTGDDAADAAAVRGGAFALSTILDTVAGTLDATGTGNGHDARASEKARSCDHQLLLRACWTTCYWNKHELYHVDRWGFVPPPAFDAPDDAPVAMDIASG